MGSSTHFLDMIKEIQARTQYTQRVLQHVPSPTGNKEGLMRITRRQALVLFDIVSASCAEGTPDIGGWSLEDRLELLNEILDQQDDEVKFIADRDSALHYLRTRLRDDGVVDAPLKVAALPKVQHAEAVVADAAPRKKAAYDW